MYSYTAWQLSRRRRGKSPRWRCRHSAAQQAAARRSFCQRRSTAMTHVPECMWCRDGAALPPRAPASAAPGAAPACGASRSAPGCRSRRPGRRQTGRGRSSPACAAATLQGGSRGGWAGSGDRGGSDGVCGCVDGREARLGRAGRQQLHSWTAASQQAPHPAAGRPRCCAWPAAGQRRRRRRRCWPPGGRPAGQAQGSGSGTQRRCWLGRLAGRAGLCVRLLSWEGERAPLGPACCRGRRLTLSRRATSRRLLPQ